MDLDGQGQLVLSLRRESSGTGIDGGTVTASSQVLKKHELKMGK